VQSLANKQQALIGLDVIARFAPTFDPNAERVTLHVAGTIPRSVSGADELPTLLTRNDFRVLRSGAWVSFDQPQILPGSAVGTTSVMSYGLQQAADGSTGIAGGMKLLPSVQSACDSSKGGLFWYVQGVGSSSDTVQICMRDSTGSYAWHALSVGSALSPPASGGGTWDHSTPAEIPVHGVPILPSQPMN